MARSCTGWPSHFPTADGSNIPQSDQWVSRLFPAAELLSGNDRPQAARRASIRSRASARSSARATRSSNNPPIGASSTAVRLASIGPSIRMDPSSPGPRTRQPRLFISATRVRAMNARTWSGARSSIPSPIRFDGRRHAGLSVHQESVRKKRERNKNKFGERARISAESLTLMLAMPSASLAVGAVASKIRRGGGDCNPSHP